MAPGGSGPEPRHPRAVRLSLRLGVQEEPPALRVQPRSAADAARVRRSTRSAPLGQEGPPASPGACPRLQPAPATR